MTTDSFESSGPESEKEWGVTRLTYDLESLSKLAKSFKDNDYFISATYTIARCFIWPNGDPEIIIDLIQQLDHIRRGELMTQFKAMPPDWIDKIKAILCPTL